VIWKLNHWLEPIRLSMHDAPTHIRRSHFAQTNTFADDAEGTQASDREKEHSNYPDSPVLQVAPPKLDYYPARS